MELVFSRPEIGTIILLSGDSDFSSLVIKLKEYGKYVIGVGIRESSSDLLVMNCDEYYSYNALAGLVKSGEEEPARKYDPWELVTEAINRMKQNHDVMRSDRLKQVMQEIDPTFDEKNLGHSKFSKFCAEASSKGLISTRRLENGQLEVDLPGAFPSEAPKAAETPRSVEAVEERDRGGRPRRGRGGRGRGGRGREERPASTPTPPTGAPAVQHRTDGIGTSGERLTRDEAFDLVRRAVGSLVRNDDSVRASVVREKARDLLGRDSESLSERNFIRILKDAHDGDIIDLRRRGDDFEVARSAAAEPVSDQLARSQPAIVPRTETPPRLSLRGRGSAPRSSPSTLPPELLALGVVATPRAASNGDEAVAEEGSKKRGGRKRAKTEGAPEGERRKAPRKPRAKKAAKAGDA